MHFNMSFIALMALVVASALPAQDEEKRSDDRFGLEYEPDARIATDVTKSERERIRHLDEIGRCEQRWLLSLLVVIRGR